MGIIICLQQIRLFQIVIGAFAGSTNRSSVSGNRVSFCWRSVRRVCIFVKRLTCKARGLVSIRKENKGYLRRQLSVTIVTPDEL